MAVIELGKSNSTVALVKSANSLPAAAQTPLASLTLKKFYAFWDLMETIQVHGYTRAAMSVIGRSTIGAWWTLQKHEQFKKAASSRQQKRLMNFYYRTEKQWDNIKDYYSLAYTLMITAMYLKYFGQAALHIIRNREGLAIGLDFLPGFVCPNVDSEGYFKNPAFYQYPTSNPTTKVSFNDPRNIVYIVNPDFEGAPSGGTDAEALTDFALPLDIYLQTAAREYMRNRDKPEAIYMLPPDISDDGFDAFVSMLEEKYSGAANVGKSPVAIRGELEIKELARLPDSLPYQEARHDTRSELLAVSGVTGAKLGITDSLSSANLRESRREFHETTMLPLFRLIESALYEQVHVREFGYPGWSFQFSNPDFLTAVETATVHMRYHQIGVLSPNEIRQEIGKGPRNGGDQFADGGSAPANNQGSPPEGRPVEPDDPSQTGEPTIDDQDPVRGDNHDDEPRESLLAEMRDWRSFVVSRMRKGRKLRYFESSVIPSELREAVQDGLVGIVDPAQAKKYFDQVIEILKVEW